MSEEDLPEPQPPVIISAALSPGFSIENATDRTKQLTFDVSNVPTATTVSILATTANGIFPIYNNQNVILGLLASPSGSKNTFLGELAGTDVTSGTKNLLLGYNATAGSSAAINRIQLGEGSAVSDNSLNISPSITDFYFPSLTNATKSYVLFYDNTTGQITYGTSTGGSSSIPPGSEALPGFPVTGDSDTGLWSSGSNTLNVSTGASEILRLNSQVLSRLGLVSAPTFSFLTDTDTGMYSSTANNLDFAAGGSRMLTISTNLQTAVGSVSAPSYSFYATTVGLYSTSANQLDFASNSVRAMSLSDAQLLLNTTVNVALPQISFVGDPDTGITNSAANNLDFSTNGTSKLNINTSNIQNKIPITSNLTSLNATALAMTNSSASSTISINNNATAGNVAEFYMPNILDNTPAIIYFGRSSSTTNAATMKFYPGAPAQLVFGINGDLLTLNSTGQLLLYNTSPSASNPFLSFSGDTNTGLYSSGADTIDMATNGVQKLSLNSTGQLLAYNTSSASSRPYYSFLGDTNTGMYSSAADNLDFATNGGNRLNINNLSIISSIPYVAPVGSVSAPTFVFSGSSNTGLYSSSSGVIDFATNGVNRLSIGTTSIVFSLPFNVSGGSASAPSYSFTGDSNTGMYSSGADTLNFATNGTEVLRVDSSGITTFVGSSTSNSTVSDGTLPAQITISSTNTGGFAVNKASSLGAIYGYSYTNVALGSVTGPVIRSMQTGDIISFFANSTTNMLQLSNLGQFNLDGTAANPSLTFISDTNTGIYRIGSDVLGFSAGGVEAMRLDGQIQGKIGSNSLPTFTFAADTNTGMYSSGADTLDFATNGVQKLSLTSGGQHLVYNTSPSASTPWYSFLGDTNTGMYSSGADTIDMATNGVQKLSLTSGGQLLIFNTTPSASTPWYSFLGDTNTGMYSSGADTIDMATNGVQKLSLTSGGQLLVYNTSPSASTPWYSFLGDTNTGMYSSAADTINFATNGSSRLSISTSAITSTLVIVNTPGATGGPSYSFTGSTTTGMYSSGSNTIDFATNGTQRLQLTSGGQILAYNTTPDQTTPWYSFLSDSDTGMYSSAANNLDFSTSGVNRLNISTAAMTSTLKLFLPTGTASTPSIANSSTNSTGIYFPSTPDVSIAISGVNTFSFNNYLAGIVGSKASTVYTNTGTAFPSSGTLYANCSISADGNTLAISSVNSGNVQVFKRTTAAAWQLNGAFPIGSTAGKMVALSADGTILVFTYPNASTNVGQFYIYQYSNLTGWNQVSIYTRSGATGGDLLGYGLAMTSSASYIFVTVEKNQFVVFKRTGVSAWSQVDTTLYAGSSSSGVSPSENYGFAASGDGSTIAFGNDNNNTNTGSVWIFVRNGTAGYVEQKRIDGGASARIGVGISLSDDGNILIYGAYTSTSTITIYKRVSGTWTSLTTISTGGSTNGVRCALTPDGLNIAALYASAGKYAVSMYKATNLSWGSYTTITPTITAITSSNGDKSNLVSVSGDFSTIAFGIPDSNSGIGGAYVFQTQLGSFSSPGSYISTTAGCARFPAFTGGLYPASGLFFQTTTTASISADGSEVVRFDSTNSVSNPLVSLVGGFETETLNTGIYRSSATSIDFTINGTQRTSFTTTQILAYNTSPSASTPWYSFLGDADTGIYSSGANTIDMATNGAQKLSLTSGGQLLVYNTTPSASTPWYSFLGDTNTGMYSSGAETIDFATNGVQKLSLTSGGQLLVYNTSPSASTPWYSFLGDTDTGIYSSAANTIDMATNGVQKFQLTSGGQILSYNTSPSASTPWYSFLGNTDTGMYSSAANNIDFAIDGNNTLSLNYYLTGNVANKATNNFVNTTVLSPVGSLLCFTSVSADGNTALIGQRTTGTVVIYTRNSAGTWSTQTTIVTGATTDCYILSADGNLMVAGMSGSSQLLYYTRSGTTWSSFTALTKSGGGAIGLGVAISGNGKYIFATVNGSNSFIVFNKSGATWTQSDTTVYTGSSSYNGGPTYNFGLSSSNDGCTVALGNDADGIGNTGKVWVFIRNNSATFTEQTRIDGGGSGYRIGSTVSLSGDGNTLAIGSGNATAGLLVYTRSAGTWTLAQTIGVGNNAIHATISANGLTIAAHYKLGGTSKDTHTIYRANPTWAAGVTTAFTLSTAITPINLAYEYNVAISGDGSVAIFATPDYNSNNGGAYVYQTQQGSFYSAGSYSSVGMGYAAFPAFNGGAYFTNGMFFPNNNTTTAISANGTEVVRFDGLNTTTNPLISLVAGYDTETFNTGIYRSSGTSIDFTVNGTQRVSFTASQILAYNTTPSASTPWYSFLGDTNTGMYSSAADTLDFATNGVNRFSMSTTAMTAKIPFYGANGSASAPTYTFATSTGAGMYLSAANTVAFATSGVLRLSISTTVITSTFVFIGPAGAVGGPTYSFTGSTTTGMYSSAANTIAFATSGVLRLSIATVITSTLVFIGPAGAVGGPTYSFTGSTTTGMYSSATNNIDFATNGSNRLSISTTAITSTLVHVNPAGAVGGPSYAFSGNTNTGMYSSTTNTIDFSCGGVRRMTVNPTSAANCVVYYTDDSVGNGFSVNGISNNNQQLFLGYNTTSNYGRVGAILQGSAAQPLRLYGSYVAPDTDNSLTLGSSSLRWTTIYATNSVINTSDKNLKDEITPLALGLDFINRLQPVNYKWKELVVRDEIMNVDKQTTGRRKHMGLIAQDVKGVLDDLKIDTMDFAAYVDSSITEEPDKPARLGINYTEFIAPLIKAVQDLSKKIDSLDARITNLENR